jgi:hypothetical protein
MTRKQLQQLRAGVEAQMRWAVLHGGDHELLELIRIHRDRLSAMIALASQQSPPHTSSPYADRSLSRAIR